MKILQRDRLNKLKIIKANKNKYNKYLINE
jgi:hypothetical protein